MLLTETTWGWSLVIGVLLVGLANVLANIGFSRWAARRAVADTPMVSVLLPARNEEANIQACVRSCSRRTILATRWSRWTTIQATPPARCWIAWRGMTPGCASFIIIARCRRA